MTGPRPGPLGETEAMRKAREMREDPEVYFARARAEAQAHAERYVAEEMARVTARRRAEREAEIATRPRIVRPFLRWWDKPKWESR